METIADLVADAHERDAVLFSTPTGSTDHRYESFLTTAWKAGNLLRHYGVRPGDSVAVVVGPHAPTEDDAVGAIGNRPTPILAILGGVLAGATVRLDPPGAVDAKALVAPTAWLDEYVPGPGTKPIGYGEEVIEPTVAQFERESWSENSVAPPVDLDPTTAAIDGSPGYAHGDLLVEARRIVAEHDLGEGDRIALRAPLTTGTLVAGVLAPLSAGATIVLGEPTGEMDVSISAAESGSTGTIDPTSLFARRRD